MEFDELVKIRRSVRAYTEEEVSIDVIKQIIECGIQAPSWENSETGRYYVALGKEAIDDIYDGLPGFNKEASKNAAYIVACFKKGESGYLNDGPSPEADYWGAYDLGLQNAYMMLKASELGYDTLVMGLRDEKRIRAYFNIPEEEMMLPVIAIGKRNRKPTICKRKEVNEILHIK